MVVVSVLLAGLMLPVASADARSAPGYCGPVRAEPSLAQLNLTVTKLLAVRATAADHRVLRRSVSALRGAAKRAGASTRRQFVGAYAPLVQIDRAGTLSIASARRLQRGFGSLARGAGTRCNLPTLAIVPDAKSAGTMARTSGADRRSIQALRLAIPRAGTDITLCAGSPDGRVSIPDNFIVDACWDGSTLRVKNRTNLVQQIGVGGSVGAPGRTGSAPQELASWVVERLTDETVLPPTYGATMSVGDGAGSLSVSPAATHVLELYGISKVVSGFIPWDPAIANDVAQLVQSLDASIAEARNCLNGANVFKKVVCSASFSVSAGAAVTSFGVSAGITFIKNGALKRVVSVLWGLIQEGKFIGDTFGDIITRSTTRLSIGAAERPSPSPVPSAPATPGGSTPAPGPSAPPSPATIAEQQGHHGVNTFTNYHNASGMGPRIDPGSWVQVSCKVYDPTIVSVNPDGYWYRIASGPWNNAYYSPANTFMNGDPWSGPYSRNTDFAVPNC